MITTQFIDKYIDNCFNNFKINYRKQIDYNEDFDFLMFRYSPSFLYFEREYGNIKIDGKIKSKLMNMNESYKIRCKTYILEKKIKEK